MKKYKYLFCDLDGTLIKTASGKTFAEDATDFRIRKDVLDKIRELHHKNGLEFIAIVTNQGGIPQYISERDFAAKLKAIETFIEEYISTPVMSYYCVSLDTSDENRKPNVGMLVKAVRDCTTILGRSEFNKEKALMIGDASGKPGQFSDSDKKTAENFGIDYMDVEDFIKLNHEDA